MLTFAAVQSPSRIEGYFLDLGSVQPGEAVVRDGDAWLHFASPREIVSTKHLKDVEGVLTRSEMHVSTGGWAVGFVSYEAGPAFDPAITCRRSEQPLAWFALFDEPPAQFWELTPTYEPAPIELEPLELDGAGYRRRFEMVKAALGRGDTYQVNLTMRQQFRLETDAAQFFGARCGVQPPPYATFIQGGDWQIASFSPELFFERIGSEIESRPMKGTVIRPDARQEAEVVAQALAADPKSMAENIMIVDMVRNDLGAVAEVGSVRVPKLLQVEPHRGLLQMTSTVRAKTTEPTLELFRRLFPPASVTGAPKVSTCRLIAELEDSPRGVYCGAIGFMAPGGERFSVAIRTAWIDAESGDGRFGIGSGLVWDSEPGAEYAECLAKRDFLLNSGEPWALIEAIPSLQLSDSTYVDRHLQRLAQSALEFDIRIDKLTIYRALLAASQTAQSEQNKVRVRLRRDGSFDVSCSQSAIQSERLTAALAFEPVDSSNPNLRFKTTSRAIFDRHLDAHPEADEVLLYNERGEITEFCRGNVVMRLDGGLVTPDPALGCLAGVGVARLVEAGGVSFGRVTLDHLRGCSDVTFVNSVVGAVPVTLMHGQPASTQHVR